MAGCQLQIRTLQCAPTRPAQMWQTLRPDLRLLIHAVEGRTIGVSFPRVRKAALALPVFVARATGSALVQIRRAALRANRSNLETLRIDSCRDAMPALLSSAGPAAPTCQSFTGAPARSSTARTAPPCARTARVCFASLSAARCARAQPLLAQQKQAKLASATSKLLSAGGNRPGTAGMLTPCRAPQRGRACAVR